MHVSSFRRSSLPIVAASLVLATSIGPGCGGDSSEDGGDGDGGSSSGAPSGGQAGTRGGSAGSSSGGAPTGGSSGASSGGRGGSGATGGSATGGAGESGAAGESGSSGASGMGGSAGSTGGSGAGGAGAGGAGAGGAGAGGRGGASGSSGGGQGGSGGQPGQPEYRGCLTIGGILRIDVVKIDRAEETCTVVSLQQSTANCGLGITANGWCLQRASLSADVAACIAGDAPSNPVVATAASGTMAVSSGAMPAVDLDVELTFPSGSSLPQTVDVQVESCAPDCSDNDCRG